jgi:CHAD domain-containing protein
MAYRLDPDLPGDDAVRATAHERLLHAAAALRGDNADGPAVAVHETRKDLKKTRSLLRLVRPALKGKSYRQVNDDLRDIARSLSDTRDADVLAETVGALAARFAGQVPKATFTSLKRSFGARARAARRRGLGGDVTAAAERLDQAAAAVAEWPLGTVDAETLRDGAARAYERGVRERERALDDPSAERLHAWRKRVKDLWYQTQLLEAAWPEVLGAHAEEAHRLSTLLGEEHDLDLLAEQLAQRQGAATDAPVDEDPVAELIGQRREELRAEAFALGARVYAERPKAYRRRLGALLQAAQDARPVAVAEA